MYKSKIIGELMSEITELEYATSKLEMLLPANIERWASQKYLCHAHFAEELEVDMITLDNYLSGTHPFTLKELCNIAYVLEISVKDLFDFS
jgi:transcriptional regulator with XRE-family HTH domain